MKSEEIFHLKGITNAMKNISGLAELRNFFGGYFHQDWVDEADEADDIVRAYIRSSGSTPQELWALGPSTLDYIQDLDEDDLERRLLGDLGCYYNPCADGLSAREWLRKVAFLFMGSE